ncbi:MAG TPA: ABC transporter ATP-binding protein [Candidatus Saccharimonadales bacterium]|nr:ABC transporter ATP-binding protein [Candidatus Saccharimonadales bacterium]
MIEVKELTKTFLGGDNKVTAVNDVSFKVERGVFGAIVGKSGSGKSTLLSLLGALDRPTKGSVIIDNQDLSKMGDRKLIGYRRDKIGFVFQNYNLIPNLTALENVMLPMEFAGIGPAKRKARATELLKEVGLSADKHVRRPGKLSGGEQQRVAIARALANKPQLILADEPTGNLDSATGKIIIDLLKNLAKTEDTTILAVTHDEGIASKAEIVFRLKDGKLAGME